MKNVLNSFVREVIRESREEFDQHLVDVFRRRGIKFGQKLSSGFQGSVYVRLEVGPNVVVKVASVPRTFVNEFTNVVRTIIVRKPACCVNVYDFDVVIEADDALTCVTMERLLPMTDSDQIELDQRSSERSLTFWRSLSENADVLDNMTGELSNENIMVANDGSFKIVDLESMFM